MLISYTNGQTSVILRVKLRQDTTGAAPGKGITALTFSSAGLIISTIADNEVSATTYTQAGSTIETVTTLGTYAAPTATKCRFKLVDNTNHPGVYEIQIADARFAVASAKSLLVSITGVSGLMDCDVVIPLQTVNPYSGNNFITGLNGHTYPAADPGAANGLLISGANTGPMTISGGVTFSNSGGDALALTSSGGNGNGLNASGNGTGDGVKATGGATGRGIHGIGGATSGAGIRGEGTAGNSLGIHGVGQGSGPGFQCDGGTTGTGATFNGGATSGVAIQLSTTSGDGLSITPTLGNGIVATANGTSKHGILATGGTLGTSDGIKAVAGTGGVDLRANITGNLTGTVATVTTLTNLPSIPANWLTATGITAGALNGKGDWLLASSYTTPPTTAQIATGVWQDATAGDFTVAGSIGKSLFTSGNAPGAASGLALVGSNMGTVTSVSGSVGSVTGAVGSVTAAITLPSIPANWITAAGINAAALSGKGDWFASGAMTESYAAKGATMTPPQALYLLVSWLTNFSISGVTYTANNLAGTPAATGTLDSATVPTQNLRAT